MNLKKLKIAILNTIFPKNQNHNQNLNQRKNCIKMKIKLKHLRLSISRRANNQRRNYKASQSMNPKMKKQEALRRASKKKIKLHPQMIWMNYSMS